MVFIVDSLEEGGPERSRVVSFEDFASADERIEYITRIKGIIWWERPHEGLDWQTPAEVMLAEGDLIIWNVAFESHKVHKRDPQRDLF